MDKFISVVITAYYEEENIRNTLKIFDEMYDPKMPFEVIVVEDGSDTNTKEICLREYKFPVSYGWQPDEGFKCAQCKNIGIRMAVGTHIFILDGDSYPSKTLIKDYWPLIDKASDKVCLYGWRHIVDKSGNIKKDFRTELKKIPPAAYDGFSGANVMIPADLAMKIEWAPDNWVGYGLDDYYFCLNWILHGGVLVPTDIVTYHLDEKIREASPETKRKFDEFKEKFTREYYGEI